MAERVGEIEVYASLDDADLQRGLRNVDRALEREKAKIEKDRAEWHIDVDLKGLRKDLKEAEAELKAASKRREEANKRAGSATHQQAVLEENLAKARRNNAKSELAAAEKLAAAKKKENAELQFTQRQLDAVAKAADKRDKLEAAAAKRREARARSEERDLARIARQREQDARAAERYATQAERSAARAASQREREIAAIPRQRREYAQLVKTIERLQDVRRGTHGKQDQIIVDLKIAEAVAKMKALHTILEREGSPVDLEVDLHPGRDLGLTLRRHLANNPTLTSAAAAVGVDLGRHMGRGMERGFRGVKQKGISGILKDIGGAGANAGLGALSRVNKLLGGLSEATIRLGPFTTTIRKAIVGMSLFAPIILDVVGALGSLVSVVGSASVGAIGAATAGFGAFGLVLGSTGLLLIPLMRDFKNLNTMQAAYHKQVLKTGAGSDKAKAKLQEFNHALGAVPESTRQAFLGISKLQDQFRGLSHQARPAFLDAVAGGLTTAHHLLAQFGGEMVQSFNLVAKGVEGAFRGLRSKSADRIFQTLFDQGQRALPAFGKALANLAHSIGNIGAAFSRVLPMLGNGFKTWTQGILDFTDNANKMNHLVDSSTESMQRFGHFAQAAGKFLTVFFGAGVGAGQSFLTTMTSALNRWSEFLQTTKGRNDLQNFFKESVHGAEVLYAALVPVISSFVRWAAMIAPFARMFFEAASGVTQFVAQFLQLTGLRGPLSALVTTLGVLWGVGKISAATQAVAGFTRALLGLSAAEKDVAVAQSAAGAASRAGAASSFVPLGMRSGIASALEKDAAAAAKTGGRFAGLRVAAAGASGAFATFAEMATGPVGIGLAAATYGAFKLYQHMTKLSESTKKLLANDDSLTQGIELQTIRTNDLRTAALNVAQAHLSEGQAQKTVNALRKHGKTNTDEYKQAVLNLKYAQQQTNDVQKAWVDQAQGVTDASKQQIDAAKANVTERQNEVKSIKDRIDAAHRQGIGDAALGDQYEKLRIAMVAVRGEQEVLRQAQDRASVGAINQQRALKLLPPIALTASRVIGDLNRALGKSKVTKIALKFPDPKDAERVMSSLNSAISSGAPKNKAFNITANAKSAEAAIQALNRIKLTPKKVEIIEHGGKAAIHTIEVLTGQKIPRKLVPIIEQGGAKALQVLHDLYGYKLPPKNQHIQQTGGQGVLGVLNDIIRKQIGDKRFKAILNDLASAGLAGILARLGGLHDKTITVTTVARTQGGGSFKHVSGVRAEGGPITPAEKKNNDIPPEMSIPTTGGKYSKPTFLVGEENKSEYVIATNPAYRQRNISYWMEAAKSLGIPGFASGGFTGSGFFASTDIGPVPGKSKAKPYKRNQGIGKKMKKSLSGKRRAKMHKDLRNDDLSSVSYVKGLLTQADDLDREYSIVEGEQVPEPETFIKEVGTDPKTGDPLYDIDQDAINAYAASFNPLIKVKDALVSLYTNLVAAIPQALDQLASRKAHAQNNSTQLKKSITLNEARISAEQHKKHPNQDKIKTLRASIKADKDELRIADGLATSAQGDINDLGGSRKEAGFKYREEVDDRSALQAQIDALTGKAQKEAASANPSADKGTSDTGSGTSDTTSITPDQQAQIDQATTLQGIVAKGNFLNSAAVSAFGSSGDIGTGGFVNAFRAATGETATGATAAANALTGGGSASTALTSSRVAAGSAQSLAEGGIVGGVAGGGSTTIINVNTLHPADPATLDAIGQAATAGVSLQGSVVSPRTVTGI